MILRRLSHHVRTQNWVAVGLDFVIVVVGVYIGVLLGNWNATSQDRQVYEESYDRMLSELRRNIESLDDTREALREPLEAVQLAIDDLRACDASEEARLRIEAAFASLGVNYGFYVDSTALEQIVGNDSFLRFQEPGRRQDLLRLLAFLRYVQRSSDNVADSVGYDRVDPRLTEPGSLTYDSPDAIIEELRRGGRPTPEFVRPTRLSVPVTELCRDESFKTWLYEWESNAYYHTVFAVMHADVLKDDYLPRLKDAPSVEGPAKGATTEGGDGET